MHRMNTSIGGKPRAVCTPSWNIFAP